MATAHFHQITPMMRYVEMLRPGSILDIGAGIGKWGFLCRDRLEYLEGRYEKSSWQTKIYGIEIYEGYRNPIWDYHYDGFWVGDVLDVLDETPDVELVLMADVLEHLPKEKGRELLARLEEKGSYILISTPRYFFKGEHDENRASEHLSFWPPEDFSGRWLVTEECGETRFFLIDLRKGEDVRLAIESAERYPFRSLVRAVILKLLHKLHLPAAGTVSPRSIRRILSDE